MEKSTVEYKQVQTKVHTCTSFVEDILLFDVQTAANVEDNMIMIYKMAQPALHVIIT